MLAENPYVRGQNRSRRQATDGVMQPDILAFVEKQKLRGPAYTLWLDVLLNAVRIVIGEDVPPGGRFAKARARAEDKHWVRTRSYALNGFDGICELVGIDANWLREEISRSTGEDCRAYTLEERASARPVATPNQFVGRARAEARALRTRQAILGMSGSFTLKRAASTLGFAASGASRTNLTTVIRELLNEGAIRIIRKSAGCMPTIYEVVEEAGELPAQRSAS